MWVSLKGALLQGMLPERVQSFGMVAIVEYFVKIKSDMKAIKDQSYQMFYRGHVQDLEICDDATSMKTLIRAKVLPSMKTDKLYKVLIIINNDTEICQANCDCASGKGPLASCKHIAAITYAVEEFARLFLRTEMDPSRTEQLSQWNRPRAKKMQAVPTYDLPFEKQKHGQIQSERKGKHPSTYQLDEICNSDVKAAKKMICDLHQYETNTNKKVGFLQVLDSDNPVTSIATQVPVGSIIDKMNETIKTVARSDKTRPEKVGDILEAVNVSEEERNRIESETKEQAATYLWMRARAKRIRASICHRVISFTNRTSGKVLVSDIIKPKSFSTAATQFGIHHEQLAITKYKDSRDVVVEKCGLVISVAKGFLAASPDGIITESNGEKGLLEVKALPSWTDILPFDAYKIPKYPVKMSTLTVNGINRKAPRLKKTHAHYHQVQLQLYCCSHFAKFVDYVILHVNVGKVHVERIFPDEEWQMTMLSKLQDFYKEKVIDELLK